MNRLFRTLAAAALATIVFGAQAGTQEFPSRPIRMIVPTEPGGSVDAVARLISAKLTERWTQGVIVDNRVGAGGIIGTEMLAKAQPDGYTIGMMTTSFTSNAATSRKVPYDAVKDFVPVALVAEACFVMVVSPSLPVKSVRELIDLAKKKPGEINYGTLGIGSSVHLATEMFSTMAGVKMSHIPYKGTASVINAVISGQVQFAIVGLSTAIPMSKAGKLRMIAVTSSHRVPQEPSLQPVSEVVPGYKFDNWFGVLAPRNTPKAVVDSLQANIKSIVAMPEVKATMESQGLEAASGSADELAKNIRQEMNDFSQTSKKLGLQLE